MLEEAVGLSFKGHVSGLSGTDPKRLVLTFCLYVCACDLQPKGAAESKRIFSMVGKMGKWADEMR